MLKMINIELEEIENIQNEVDNGVISISDIENRWVSMLMVLLVGAWLYSFPLPTQTYKQAGRRKCRVRKSDRGWPFGNDLHNNYYHHYYNDHHYDDNNHHNHYDYNYGEAVLSKIAARLWMMMMMHDESIN